MVFWMKNRSKLVSSRVFFFFCFGKWVESLGALYLVFLESKVGFSGRLVVVWMFFFKVFFLTKVYTLGVNQKL